LLVTVFILATVNRSGTASCTRTDRRFPKAANGIKSSVITIWPKSRVISCHPEERRILAYVSKILRCRSEWQQTEAYSQSSQRSCPRLFSPQRIGVGLRRVRELTEFPRLMLDA